MTQSPTPNRPAPPPVPPPLAQPVMPVTPPRKPEDPRAQKLVTLSHWFGWGGIILLLVGAPALGILVGVNETRDDGMGIMVGLVTAGIGLLMAIAGAIIG